MTLADFSLPAPLRRALVQFARVVCPDDAEGLDLIEPVADHAECMMRALPPHARAGLVAGLAAFEASAILTTGRRFSSLDLERARRHFERWLHARFGLASQLMYGLKALTIMGYYEHPVVRARIEYQPDAWIAKVARERLDKYGADIAQHEEDLLRPDPLIIAPRVITRKVRHA